MIGLIFIIAALIAYIASINYSKLLWGIPVIVSLFSWSILLGLLTLVVFVTLYDPLRKLKGLDANTHNIKGYIRGSNGLYDIWDYRIVLIVEIFALIVLTSETWLTLIPA